MEFSRFNRLARWSDRPAHPLAQAWQVRYRRAIAGTVAITLLTMLMPTPLQRQATAQTASPQQPLRLEADIQEANSVTGVITARGNVRIDYPARQIQATAVQAQYFSRERRIVLSGDVYILQEGNSLRGEVVTYLIDEGRFIAMPDRGERVESIYLVADPNAPAGSAGSQQPTFNPKPAFKDPISDP
ncbi:LptA/OstA family protein [Leptolyngbya sp. AN02str]|uniref:LptA/OstA family protein n=1 Tax=Leptolyngbya sp. AN02str TaxID=3423363 RepID=UPI003D312044